ncbi:hypothetical protein Ddye_005331 [Dipteronia dyeriana]|uniref:Uncharacterized protein n=1 Tax=Dipteronia dyeriana TaxID=168575 RepID=A0AAE0CQ53_9ROSI|nr:hypothetical protein Ddye_005331 [Dipteronia dyeriana]
MKLLMGKFEKIVQMLKTISNLSLKLCGFNRHPYGYYCYCVIMDSGLSLYEFDVFYCVSRLMNLAHGLSIWIRVDGPDPQPGTYPSQVDRSAPYRRLIGDCVADVGRQTSGHAARLAAVEEISVLRSLIFRFDSRLFVN